MEFSLKIFNLKTVTAIAITIAAALCFFTSAGIITRDFATRRTVQETTLEEQLNISKIQLCFKAPIACFETINSDKGQTKAENLRYAMENPYTVDECHHTFVPNGLDKKGFTYEKLFMGINQVDNSYQCGQIDTLGSEEREYAMNLQSGLQITNQTFVLRSKTEDESKGVKILAFLIGLYYTDYNYLQDPDKHYTMIQQDFEADILLPNEIVVQLSARKFQPIDRSDCLESPDLAPSGFARTVCEAECTDEAVLSQIQCKMFPDYSGIGWKNNNHTTSGSVFHRDDICTADDVKIAQGQDGFEEKKLSCMEARGCKTQRYCEEWQLSTQITHNSIGDESGLRAGGKIGKKLNIYGTRETIIKVYVEKPFLSVRDVYAIDFVAWVVALGGFLGLWMGLGCRNLGLFMHKLAFGQEKKNA